MNSEPLGASAIDELVSLGADEIHLMDDNVTFDRNHAIELCKAIADQPWRIDICSPNGVRLDRLDREMLEWMKRAGWYHLGFGIEVGSNEALKTINKGETMELIQQKIALVKEVGLSTTGFFILGFPHDTIESMRETVATADRFGLDMASIHNFTPLPGTKIFEELVEKGEIEQDYLPSFGVGITYAPPGMTTKQLARFRRNAVLRYWVTPRRIWLVLSRTKLRDWKFVIRRLSQIVLRPLKD